MTHEEVLNTIRACRDKEGGVRKLAVKWKVSAAYVSDVLLGRRNPGPKILKHLGLVGVVQVVRTFTARRQQPSGERSKGRSGNGV